MHKFSKSVSRPRPLWKLGLVLAALLTALTVMACNDDSSSRSSRGSKEPRATSIEPSRESTTAPGTVSPESRGASIFPGGIQRYIQQGDEYLNAGEYDRAIAEFDAAINADPDSAEVYSKRGLAYAKLGVHDRAIADLDTAIGIYPDSALAYSNRSLIYSLVGEYDRAIADSEAALRIDSLYASAYSNRGLAYYFMGELNRAVDDFDEALRINPDDGGTYKNRGSAYAGLEMRMKSLG